MLERALLEFKIYFTRILRKHIPCCSNINLISLLLSSLLTFNNLYGVVGQAWTGPSFWEVPYGPGWHQGNLGQ